MVLAVTFFLIGIKPTLAALVAFDIAAVIFLGSTLYTLGGATVASMRKRARLEDGGYWGFLLNAAAAAVVALIALGMQLHASKAGGLLDVVLAASTLLLSWLFLNTIFALHYAHSFYGDGNGKGGGLEFPGTKEPDYWDFLYFSFILGMTFQVSDVEISDRGIRRVVLAHSMISFLFNVIVIALSVNVAASGT
ncbi:MAG: DUF1345 domain-containing protein [Dokdonella sp.]